MATENDSGDKVRHEIKDALIKLQIAVLEVTDEGAKADILAARSSLEAAHAKLVASGKTIAARGYRG